MLFVSTECRAQVKGDTIRKTDTVFTALPHDTVKAAVKKEPVKYHSPKKAATFSAIVPGAGQVYNKKYWKLPIIYGGFAGLAYSFQFNQSRYVKYRDALKTRLDDDASTVDPYIDIYNDDQLTTLYQGYHRYRDLTVIGGVALYLLNIVDAAVDAHLFTFNVSDDLSLNIHPALINTAGKNQYTTGIGFNIKF
ncbi:MAG: hypothetical protein JWO44_2738 [Bacteroidetes bacterium]|nr:hypothetical protein [Bacteroidota bacterium]